MNDATTGRPKSLFDRTRHVLRSLAALSVLMLWSGLLLVQPARQAEAQQSLNNGFEARDVAIINARIVTAPGQELPSGMIVIRRGLIASVTAETVPPADVDVLDAKGLVIYPGWIDAASSSPIDAEKALPPEPGRKIDYSRYALAGTPLDNRKNLTPQFEPQTALKADFPAFAAQRRESGFTSLVVVPNARGAGGQGTLLSLSGAPLREALITYPVFSQFQLAATGGGGGPGGGPGGGGYPSTAMGVFAHLRQLFIDARRHQQHLQLFAQQAPGIDRPADDPTLSAVVSCIERKTPMLMRADNRDDILRSLGFCTEQQLPAIIWGGSEAWQCIDALKQSANGVIVTVDWGEESKFEAAKLQDKLPLQLPPPTRVQQAVKARYNARIAGLAKLHEAQIPFAISSEGTNDPKDVLAGLRTAIKAGLPKEGALAAVTTNAAKLLGVESRMGTIAPGKLASLTILNGPMEDERSVVRYVFVDGYKSEFNKDAEPVVPATPGGLDLTGKWTLEVTGADGAVPGTLELQHSGKSFTGTWNTAEAEGRVTQGKFDGKEISFSVAIGAGAQTIELKLTGAPVEKTDAEKADANTPDKIAGTLKSAFGAATQWTATRPAKPAAPVATDAAPKAELAAATPAATPAEGAANDKPESKREGRGGKKSDAPIVSSVADAFPTELDADRRQRHIVTSGNVFIRGGTVWTGIGDPQPDTHVLIQGGKFAAIGKEITAPEGITVIDATGRWVIPGLMDTHSHIMFGEGLGGVNEATLSIVPEVRVRDVLSSDDPQQYRALAGGLVAARLLHGSANVIGGQDAVVKFKYGEPLSKQILSDNPIGIKFALGENVKFQRGRFPNTRLGVEAVLSRAFVEALDYRRQWMDYQKLVSGGGDVSKVLPPRRDLRLEALADIVSGTKFIHCHSYRSDEILALLRIASLNGIRVQSLQHVLEGYKVAPEIKAHGASCSTFADWWAYKVEAYDATPFNAALLNEAGINTVIKSDDAELIRQMQLEAAKTVRYGGMPMDAALRAVTLNSARELGLDSRMGSIEVGKDADVAIFSGHPFSSFSRCEYTLIDGEVYFVREKQPSVMSAAAAAATAHLPALPIPSAEVRARKLDLPAVASLNYAIVNAVIHPVDAPEISQGTVLVQGDKIAAIGAGIAVPADHHVIDAQGLHVYPGLIDPGTLLGLTEIGKVTETQDYSETGAYHPDLKAGVAVNPDSELLPVARTGGITLAYIRPESGVISGQGSLMKLEGWTNAEMVLNYEAGLHINLPGFSTEQAELSETGRRRRGRNRDSLDKLKKDAEEEVERLKEFLAQGRTYDRLRTAAVAAGTTPPLADPRYEALVPYLRGEKRVFIEANTRQEIAAAIAFAEKEKLKLVVTGARDAWKITDELKAREIPVVLGPVMQRPGSDVDPFDAPYACAGRLHEAGILFCIRSFEASNSRNAPLEAARAVAYGLPEEMALKSVTLNAARVLQIDDRYGSLTPGKLANLVICDGSPLQSITQYKAIFIHGKPFAPESRQTKLYEKYRERLHQVQSAAKTPAQPATTAVPAATSPATETPPAK